MIVRGEKMEVYIELTYLTNYLIILVALEMMAILISKEMSYLMVIKHSFYLSGVILLLYLDSYSWLIILIWAVVFLCLYQRQIFLYYPIFIFVYFSLLLFASSIIPEAFIHNGILISPVNVSSIGLFIVSLLVVLMQIMFIVYLKRKIRIDDYLYVMKLDYQQHSYTIKGFLDSGNEVYYEGFPLILINQKIIDEYEVIDVLELNDLREDIIEIIKVDQVIINNQRLQDIYVGVIAGIQYDCLLNKSLMGGIL